MQAIKGIKLTKLGFSLKKMGDFLFHEGPIQSHFINEKNEDYLFFWADTDDRWNRWMVVKSTPETLHRFFAGAINTCDLIAENPDDFVYFIDADSKGEWKDIYLVSNEEIPISYYPSDDSFYLPAHYEKYAHDLKDYLDHCFSRREKLYTPIEVESEVVCEPQLPYSVKK